MNKLYSLLLMSSLVFSGLTIAKAQPPDGPESQVQIGQHMPQTAEQTLDDFIRGINTGSITFAAEFVEGADKDSSSLQKLQTEDLISMGHLQLRAVDFKITPDPKNPELVVASYTLLLLDSAVGYHLNQSDSIILKRYSPPDGTYWMLVPDEFTTTDQKPTQVSGMIQHFVTIIAHPDQALPEINLSQSELQLRRLMLALSMFVQDNNELINFGHQDYTKKLSPYLPYTLPFTAPDDPLGTTSFEINPYIIGANFYTIQSPENVVLFYFGKNQKLDFRYDRLSPVCFSDGHIEEISPEQAKDLRWKP